MKGHMIAHDHMIDGSWMSGPAAYAPVDGMAPRTPSLPTYYYPPPFNWARHICSPCYLLDVLVGSGRFNEFGTSGRYIQSSGFCTLVPQQATNYLGATVMIMHPAAPLVTSEGG